MEKELWMKNKQKRNSAYYTQTDNTDQGQIWIIIIIIIIIPSFKRVTNREKNSRQLNKLINSSS